MFHFDPNAYGAAAGELLADAPLNELGPGSPRESAATALEALDEAALLEGAEVADHDMARGCIAGLWLRYGFLDRSHRISQEIDTPSGSYWHSIMHRREPDYSNSKYWFHRVGDHPLFESLRAATTEMAAAASLDAPAEFLAQQASWDPFRWVDLIEAVARGRSSCEDLCRQVAQVEWELLFDFCYQRAAGR